MDHNKSIKSIKVSAGKRTYFLDVNLTIEGGKYLNISERKRLRNGEYEGHRIIIFEENINKFVEALHSGLQHFETGNKAEQKSKMEGLKEKFKNAYRPWTDEEDLRLTELFCQGKKPKAISEIFQRNPGAINSRIKKLGLKQKYR